MNQIESGPAAAAARSELKSRVEARKRHRKLAALFAAAAAKQPSDNHRT
jgi:hypothetical protein